MYTTPNGMVFKDYWAAVEWSRNEIRKEFEKLLDGRKSICPNCKEKCIKSEVSNIYICGNCLRAYSLEEGESEDESENQNECDNPKRIVT